MFHNLLFLPANSLHQSSTATVQATLIKPPASTSSAREQSDTSRKQTGVQFGFMVSVAGNAVGFAGLMAGCWLSLQLLHSFL